MDIGYNQQQNTLVKTTKNEKLQQARGSPHTAAARGAPRHDQRRVVGGWVNVDVGLVSGCD